MPLLKKTAISFYNQCNELGIILLNKIAKVINLPENYFKLHFDDYRNVFNKLLRMIKNKDIIMIKGSNSINLHMICEKLIMLG